MTTNETPGELPTHFQTIEHATAEAKGRYRRNCSCGYVGAWLTLGDAMSDVCPREAVAAAFAQNRAQVEAETRGLPIVEALFAAVRK